MAQAFEEVKLKTTLHRFQTISFIQDNG